MNDYVIIPDTSCDLTADLRARFDIPDYLRGVVTYPDGHSEHVSLDWENITPTQFYESMKDKKSWGIGNRYSGEICIKLGVLLLVIFGTLTVLLHFNI